MTNQSMAKKIVSTFEANLFSLPLRNQQHWCVRMWRLTGDHKYIEPVFLDLQIRSLKYLPMIRRLSDGESVGEMSAVMVSRFHPTSERRQRRIKVYEDNPEVFLFIKLIHYLFMCKAFGFDEKGPAADYFKAGLGFLKRHNVEKLIMDGKLIRINPSAVANTIYYLQYLGIADAEGELLQAFEKQWIDYEPKNSMEWEDKVYGLTHLVIAASYFYQRKLERSRFGFVVDYFEKNIDAIIARTNPDIVAEVGVSLKLCDASSSPALRKAGEYIALKFNPKLGYIPREGENSTLNKAEHRNILSVFLFSQMKEFFQGPDLVKFMRERKLSFYIPKEGEFVGSHAEIEE